MQSGRFLMGWKTVLLFLAYWINFMFGQASSMTSTESFNKSDSTTVQLMTSISTVPGKQSSSVSSSTTNSYEFRTITPNNDLPCSVLDEEYGSYNFDVKYTVDQVQGLLCKCMNMCMVVDVPEDLRKELQEYRYNPLSPNNRPEFVAVLTTFAILFSIGCTGNLITIYGLLRWVKHKTPTFAFIISLSCSDLFLLLICMPVRITEHFYVANVFTEVTCKLSYYIRDVIRICAVLTLTSISFERYYAICRPLVVQYRCTWPRARKIIIVTWLMSTILAIPTIFMTTFYAAPYMHYIKECLPQSPNDLYVMLYFGYYMGLMFLVPAAIMCCTYGLSCHGLWRSTVITMSLQGKKRDVVVKTSSGQGSAVQSKTTPKEQDDVTSRRRVIKVLILIVLIYLISWGTPLIVQLMAVLDKVTNNRREVRLASDALIFFSSSLNPYMFMIMSSKFCPKTHPCMKLCRRRRALAYSKTKGSSISMTNATTSATAGTDESANYS